MTFTAPFVLPPHRAGRLLRVAKGAFGLMVFALVAAFFADPSSLTALRYRRAERLQDQGILTSQQPGLAPIVFGAPVPKGWPPADGPDVRARSVILRYTAGRLASFDRTLDDEDPVADLNRMLSEKESVHVIVVITLGTRVPDVVPLLARLREAKARLITVNFEGPWDR